MLNFNYYSPTKVVFGKGTESQVGSLVKEHKCNKVLLHYGSGSVIKTGLLDRIKKSLDNNSISYVELGGVVPNPRLSLVRQGIELAKNQDVDFILAVGGGSVIDSSKAIGYGVANEGDVWDFYDYKREPSACLPIGVVLTIAAAGSELSRSSVITNEEGWIKRATDFDICRPKFAIMNPELTMTLSDYQTACGCTDILVHTFERYFTCVDTLELTTVIAEGLLRTVINASKVLKNKPKDYKARAEIMWAGSLSHNDLTGCSSDGGDWCAHVLEHEIGGLFDVAHGAGLAAIWASWARYVYKDCFEKFYRFAINVMDVKPSEDKDSVILEGIKRVEMLFDEIGMPTTIKGLGINPTEDDLKTMAHKCSICVGGHKGSAKILYEEDMLNIYKMALK